MGFKRVVWKPVVPSVFLDSLRTGSSPRWTENGKPPPWLNVISESRPCFTAVTGGARSMLWLRRPLRLFVVLFIYLNLRGLLLWSGIKLFWVSGFKPRRGFWRVCIDIFGICFWADLPSVRWNVAFLFLKPIFSKSWQKNRVLLALCGKAVHPGFSTADFGLFSSVILEIMFFLYIK